MVLADWLQYAWTWTHRAVEERACHERGALRVTGTRIGSRAGSGLTEC